jgi:hypothetical protein
MDIITAIRRERRREDVNERGVWLNHRQLPVELIFSTNANISGEQESSSRLMVSCASADEEAPAMGT